VKLASGRVVVDYQVGNEAVKRLGAVFVMLVRKWETNYYCLVELKPAFALKIPKLTIVVQKERKKETLDNVMNLCPSSGIDGRLEY
jgi:hypothetical protein